MKNLKEFKTKHDRLICFDSDGCVMDTMNIKHERCFGPCLIQVWMLEEWQDPILKRWNEINLFTSTRGVNRFQGLNMILHEVDATYCPIEGLDDLALWVETANELSEASLQKEAAHHLAPALTKALSWSQTVNQQIALLPENQKLPFFMAAQGLNESHRCADVAVVSSANADAIEEEWQLYGLLDFVDVILAQNAGSKKDCIRLMLEQGYDRDHVLMVGDAPGDQKAAAANGVRFYPILVGIEAQSWNYFRSEALPKFLEGTFDDAYQHKMNQAFLENLS